MVASRLRGSGRRGRLTRRQFIEGSAALAGLAAFGCAPSVPPSSTPAGGLPATTDTSALATVNLATTGVAKGIVDVEGLTHHHQPEIRSICHCPLTQYDHDYNVIPVLAESVPSVDDGSWRLNSDGTMTMTWHLRKGVKWHDGHPFTGRDIRFSWEFANDRTLPTVRRPIHTNVTAMDLPDDHTLVMHWKVTNNQAHIMTLSDLFIYPEHIVRPLWESGDGERILSNNFFLHEFVGLGPYRIDRWNADETIVYKPFDDFFLGRPKIGTIVMHQVESSEAILTRLLAGTIQMAAPYGLTFEDGTIAQERWEATGDGKVYFTPVSLQRLIVKPDNPLFRDPRVRQALLLAIDREELNATFFKGQAQIAHSLLHPSEPGFKAADTLIAKYGFEPRRSLALMEQAGWQRGSDGTLANAAGDRFEVGYRVSASDREQQRIQGAVAKYWSDIGVRTKLESVAESVSSNAQERATYLGVTQQGGGTSIGTLFRRWHSQYIARAENRYIGDNLAGWANPQSDALLEQLERSFTQSEIEGVLVQLARVFADDMPALPLYYNPEAVAIHRGLQNARPRPNSSGQHSSTWSVHQWEWAP
jgi:peptide/nickel transport system substrate-binding protein